MNFSEKLIGWYKTSKRDLPWRNTDDPYKIWLSEIILQQTRVDQGLDYYHRFTDHFPDISSLAGASEEKILKLWQGLGYYSRARNLHAAAKFIKENYRDQFPFKYEEVLKLNGVGEYTAAAICSFAFNQPYPVVDGNVMRVISRLKGIELPVNSATGKKSIAREAEKMLDRDQPGIFNQAIMEFGALYCKPRKPDCEGCIFRKECAAYMTGRVDKIPVKQTIVKQKHRYFHYLVLISHEPKTVLLKKRSKEDIWKNLYDFPLIESDRKLSSNTLFKKIKALMGTDSQCQIQPAAKTYKHVLTHRVIHAQFIEINCRQRKDFCLLRKNLNTNIVEATPSSLHQFPIPRLIEKFIQENSIFI